MLAIVLLAQTAVPWSGQGLCPPGYYRYGNYCTPTTRSTPTRTTTTCTQPAKYTTTCLERRN